MNSLQSELDTLFAVDTIEELGKKEEIKTKRSSQKQPKQPKVKLIKQPLLHVAVNNESKYFKVIELLTKTDLTKFVIPYGGTGLIAYWIKQLKPESTVIMNDSDDIVSKLPLDNYLDGVTIEHKEPTSYLNELDPEAVYIINPRSFTIDAINYIGKNCNLVLMGNSKNRNLDYIVVYNQLVSPTNPIDGGLHYVTEFDYVFNSFEHLHLHLQ